jgi:hypothetical protein
MTGGPRTQALGESGKAPEPEKAASGLYGATPGAAAPGNGCIAIFHRPRRNTFPQLAPGLPKLAPAMAAHTCARNPHLRPKAALQRIPAGKDGRGGHGGARKEKFFCAKRAGRFAGAVARPTERRARRCGIGNPQARARPGRRMRGAFMFW